MADTFLPCRLRWSIWPWGLDLSHSDTDAVPECTVEFGAQIARIERPFSQRWVRITFDLAAFVCAKPHRDDEDIRDVTGYDIAPRSADRYEADLAQWLVTGICPDPGVYFSTDSSWLLVQRETWARRLRGNPAPEQAVHFLIDGRDGYIEILASGFTWAAWPQGAPRLNSLTDEPPVEAGRWPGST